MRNKSRCLAPNKLTDKLWLNYVSTDNESSWHFSWKGTWRRFRGNGDWNAEVSDQHAILPKNFIWLQNKKKGKKQMGILIAHTHGLLDCHHYLHAVLLKVALIWLSSEYRGRGVGVCLQKNFLDVSCGEKDPYFVYDIYQISEEVLMKALWEQREISKECFCKKKKKEVGWKLAKMSKSKDRGHRKREPERRKQHMWLLD